ncbi:MULTISPECIES: hypothetical protein [unclassified Microcoleus]|uniref:hypothetical protein n=1 Tax=unclassified Microcoleus TaxID=2642155 RepID=UPI001DBD85A8|nr:MULTISPECIES: hypothetical protein [unclassified Microcoleus]MCC3438578.1 hypothetical protein [Microcoleus sp. PH2017_05_CCC_O_A]MCC3585168.1 hypothetical protein [Microcoleus sp. PH2017_30_WIL_O_A]TAG48374.1 MAG: hypothetical protein EAZ33_03280 [Oscillatoriales cyanobacterium]TAG60949.1 MAG: hypothetical protein EAZ28_05455 [Oscillatoriales cyanobacterium]
MSEYQYYEFKTIDRPLTKAEKEEISLLSSRVQLSSTTAIFTYSYGDFRGSPEQVLAKYFDAMFYTANWGTLQLMFRFPKGSIDLEQMQKYCIEDLIAVSEINNFVILDISINDEEGFGWIEGEGNLSSLIGSRQEILQGDYRLLYLAWLKAITCPDLIDEFDEEELEPPVPPGLGKLSSSLQAFIDAFELNEHLLKVATSASVAKPSISDKSLKEAIKKLDRSESDAFLLRLAKGEANLSFELRKKSSEMMGVMQNESLGERTIKQLLESAEQEQEQSEHRKEQATEVLRIRELEIFAQRETAAWEDVDALIQRGTSKSYDEVVPLLLKLRDLADYQNQETKFLTRIKQLHEQYSKRSGLKQRLLQANL